MRCTSESTSSNMWLKVSCSSRLAWHTAIAAISSEYRQNKSRDLHLLTFNDFGVDAGTALDSQRAQPRRATKQQS